MKANEFIKKFGYCKADYLWRNYSDKHIIFVDNGEEINLKELGKILESKQLIKKFGGIKRIKERMHKVKYTALKNRLREAILDLESCQ